MDIFNVTISYMLGTFFLLFSVLTIELSGIFSLKNVILFSWLLLHYVSVVVDCIICKCISSLFLYCKGHMSRNLVVSYVCVNTIYIAKLYSCISIYSSYYNNCNVIVNMPIVVFFNLKIMLHFNLDNRNNQNLHLLYLLWPKILLWYW